MQTGLESTLTSRQGAIGVEQLRLGYHDGETVLALDDLTIEAGSFVSVLGPSGCGKSTLLSALAGFITPREGRILIDDVDVTHVAPQHRETGLVFQNYALFPHLTVEKNLLFGLKARHVPRSQREARVQDALELVGLSEYRARYPQQLSGGQQQRVAIARALVTRPKVLLLDEPLSNLDAKLRRQMRQELRELQQTVGTTTVFVTHDQSEALAMSDRVILLADGHLEQDGTPQELYQRPRTPFVADFIGAANVLTTGGEETATVLGRPSSGGRVGRAVALRPEAIDVRAPGSPDTVVATVEAVSFGGDRYEYRLRVDDAPDSVVTAATAAAGSGFHTGDRVGLHWDDADLIWLEDE